MSTFGRDGEKREGDADGAEVITVDGGSLEGVEMSVQSPSKLSIVRPQQKDSMWFYLNRIRHRHAQAINLQQPSGQLIPARGSGSIPIALPIVTHKRQRERAEQKIINVEEQSNKINVEKYKKAIFKTADRVVHSKAAKKIVEQVEQLEVDQSSANEGSQSGEIEREGLWNMDREERILRSKAVQPTASDRSKQMERQIKLIEDMGTDRHRQKPPSFNAYASTYNLPAKPRNNLQQFNDATWQQYCRQQQIQSQKNKEKQDKLRKQEQTRKQDVKKQRDRQQSVEVKKLLEGLMGMHPEKRLKVSRDQKAESSDNLQNESIIQRINAEDGDDNEALTAEQSQASSEYVLKKRQNRYGLTDIIKTHESCAHFINAILSHNYKGSSTKLQSKKIPEIFSSQSTYKKVFHYLITNECIAEVSQKLKTIEKRGYEAIKIGIRNVKRNNQGITEVQLQESGKDKEGVEQLRNYSLSKYRLGLLCSSREYVRGRYGLSSEENSFGFLVLLVTPETKQDLSKEVLSISSVNQIELQWILRGRNSRQAYYFDLQKLTTHVREYLAVSNLPYSELAPAVLDPRILEKQMNLMVQRKEVLTDVLTHLNSIFNETQWQSIRDMVLRERGFVLLQGPPGTGKTSTLMGLLSAQYEYLKKTNNNRKIMICAPSNAAVDHIVKRIQCEGLFNGQGDIIHPSILRVGIIDSKDEDVLAVSLDELCQRRLMEVYYESRSYNLTTPQIKQKIITLQKQMRKLNQRRDQKQLNLHKSELIQLENMLYNFRKERVLSRRYYSQVQSELLTNTEIILTTLSSAGNDKLDKIRGEIACLIIDEAAQATEPTLLIALQTGVQKVMLIGDPYQLPATCMSSDANVTLFNRSLFQRFLDAKIKPYFLNIQYRMAPIIRQFPSYKFYQNRLLDSQSVVERKLPTYLRSFSGRNVVFLDVRFGEQKKRGQSNCNEAEARVIGILIRALYDKSVSVGVITPYQAQRRLILSDCQYELRDKEQQRELIEKNVMINTVDSFQGQQKDVIIVSTVRANREQQVGFLTDERRINVTLTRSKYLLVVVGHGDTLGSNEIWNSFLEWVEGKNCYYWVNNREDVPAVVDKMFLKFNRAPVRRIKYGALSSDIRKRRRNAIESQDFRQKVGEGRSRSTDEDRQECSEDVLGGTVTEASKFSIDSVSNGALLSESLPARQYNLNVEQSQQIIEEKRRRQKQSEQFADMHSRLRRLQRENGDLFKMFE